MKKVLSIMLVAMMLTSLFAVNASASVATYEGYDFITVFDTSENVKSALPNINTSAYASGATPVSSFATVDDNEVAILKANPNGADWVFGQAVATLTALDKFTLEFDVKAVDCSDALNVTFKTDKGVIGVYITPATFIGAVQTAGSLGYTAKITDLNSVKLNQWFNFKITVDKTIYNASDAEATRKKAVTVEYKKAEEDSFKTMTIFDGASYGYKVGGRLTTANPTWTGGGAVAFSPDADGYAYCVDADDNSLKANVEYHIDNVRLTGRTNKVVYPSTGVVMAQDYEDSGNTAATSKNHFGTLERVTADGNSYLSLKPASTSDTACQGWVKFVEGSTSFTLADYELAFDVKCATQGTGLAVNIYGATEDGQSSSSNLNEYAFYIDSSNFDAGDWYRYKFTTKTFLDKNGGTAKEGVVMRKNLTDGSDWENVTSAAATAYQGQSSASGLIVVGCMSSKDAVGNADISKALLSEYHLDNIVVTNKVALTVPSVKCENGAVSATINLSDGARMNKTGNLSVFLAAYDADNRVVGVDYAEPTMTVGEISADVSVAEAENVKLYVWEAGTAVPVLLEAYDIDALLK